MSKFVNNDAIDAAVAVADAAVEMHELHMSRLASMERDEIKYFAGYKELAYEKYRAFVNAVDHYRKASK